LVDRQRKNLRLKPSVRQEVVPAEILYYEINGQIRQEQKFALGLEQIPFAFEHANGAASGGLSGSSVGQCIKETGVRKRKQLHRILPSP
jgi:hypothetical protein